MEETHLPHKRIQHYSCCKINKKGTINVTIQAAKLVKVVWDNTCLCEHTPKL